MAKITKSYESDIDLTVLSVVGQINFDELSKHIAHDVENGMSQGDISIVNATASLGSPVSSPVRFATTM